MHEDEKLIRDNISSLLSHHQVKAKTGTIGGEWSLLDDQIHASHGTPKNVAFTVVLVNGDARCISVAAKIHRDTARLSNIVVYDL